MIMAKYTLFLLTCFLGVLVDAELRILVVPPEEAMEIIDEALKCGSGMRDSYLQIIKECAGAAVPIEQNWRAHLVDQLERMEEIGATAQTANTRTSTVLLTDITEAATDASVAATSAAAPSSEPSSSPTKAPSSTPSTAPSADPSSEPSSSGAPSAAPSSEPSSSPTKAPSSTPSTAPSAAPAGEILLSGASVAVVDSAPLTRMLLTDDAGTATDALEAATEARRRRLGSIDCSPCHKTPLGYTKEVCCLSCGICFGLMSGNRRLELKGNSTGVDNSDPSSRHLKGRHKIEDVRRTEATDFLEEEFQIVRALPAINQQCRVAFNKKCSEEITQAAPFQKECWGCNPTTGKWMGNFVAWSILTGLDDELP
jgi:hypothetical protein